MAILEDCHNLLDAEHVAFQAHVVFDDEEKSDDDDEFHDAMEEQQQDAFFYANTHPSSPAPINTPIPSLTTQTPPTTPTTH
eukprot:10144074-Ditylum_brightwellii.AAC.1